MLFSNRILVLSFFLASLPTFAFEKKVEKKVEIEPVAPAVTKTEDKKAEQDMQLRICIMPEQGDKPVVAQPYVNPVVPAGPCKPSTPSIPTALPYQPEEFFTTRHQTDYKKMRVLFSTEYVTMKGTSEQLRGLGFTATALYSINSQYAMGFSLSQAFISTSLTAFYTQLDAQVKYALTGNLMIRNSSVALNQTKVIESETANTGGLRAHVFAHQYFMNASVAALPFPGMGLGLSYDFPSTDWMNYYIGVRVDRASNDKVTTYPIQAFFGVGLWL